MSSLGGQRCSPPSLVASVVFALGAFLFCSRGAVSSFSSSCYGCCQLLLRLLGVFSSASLGTPAVFPLGVMWLAALLGFPCWLLFSEWQAVREALLFPIGVLHPWRVLQPFWLQFAGLLLRWCLVVGLEGYLLRHLVFSHVPCSSSGPAACAAFPAAGYLGVFRSPGVCPSASLVTLFGFQPFPSFSVLLLLRLLAGVGWVMHPMSGCSICGGVCLG